MLRDAGLHVSMCNVSFVLILHFAFDIADLNKCWLKKIFFENESIFWTPSLFLILLFRIFPVVLTPADL